MEKSSGKEFIVSVIKGAFLSLIASLIGLLLFALILKCTGVSEKAIKPVNQFIKTVSIFIGCFFAVKGKNGLIKGVIIGLIYTVLIYSVFAIISGGFNSSFFLDLIFGLILGGLSGAISVNIRKDKE